MKALLLKSVLLSCISLQLASTLSTAQSATFYACAENDFKLRGAVGFDEYEWSLDGSIIAGADSSILPVDALGAATVGNNTILKNYSLKVRNVDGCWSDEAAFAVHILPKLSVSAEGSIPPYCENMVLDINLTALVNGSTGTSALSLPDGVDISYEWSIVSGEAPSGNAAIIAGATEAIATIRTPATSATDNSYKIKVSYNYPSGVNVATEVVGNCEDELVETIHAEPAPTKPTINYTHL